MEVLKTISKFQINDRVMGYAPLGAGHINTTFLVKTKSTKWYVLQKINDVVFNNVNHLMKNIYRTTDFLKSKGYETLEVVKTKDNKLFYQDESGSYRLYLYIDNVVCYEGVNDLDMVYDVAKAFGLLHKSLCEFDASSLYEIIPNFHNTKYRYEQLLQAIKENKSNRVKDCLEEIEFFKKHEDNFSTIVDGIERGEIRLAVTHNDPKINNVLFDRETGNTRAVIDLDTVMPGSYLYDYGDALRSLFTGEYEDSKDLSKVGVDYPVFETYTKGYLSEMKGVLNEKEISLLPFAIYLISAELAMRFLTDFINGDVYFKTTYSEHNLVRARTQIKLASDIYEHLPQLNKIVEKCYKIS